MHKLLQNITFLKMCITFNLITYFLQKDCVTINFSNISKIQLPTISFESIKILTLNLAHVMSENLKPELF